MGMHVSSDVIYTHFLFTWSKMILVWWFCKFSTTKSSGDIDFLCEKRYGCPMGTLRLVWFYLKFFTKYYSLIVQYLLTVFSWNPCYSYHSLPQFFFPVCSVVEILLQYILSKRKEYTAGINSVTRRYIRTPQFFFCQLILISDSWELFQNLERMFCQCILYPFPVYLI